MLETWDQAIAAIFAREPGRIMSRTEIYRTMAGHTLVTPLHRKPGSGGRPRYENWVNAALANLVKLGRIECLNDAWYYAK